MHWHSLRHWQLQTLLHIGGGDSTVEVLPLQVRSVAMVSQHKCVVVVNNIAHMALRQSQLRRRNCTHKRNICLHIAVNFLE